MTQVLVTTIDIDKSITKLAASLIDDFSDTSPLFVCLLRGAAPFAMKVMQEITRQAPTFHPELDYLTVKTYGDERAASAPQIITDLTPSTIVRNRPVVVLDDVLDSGATAAFVSETLKTRGASQVTLAVLVEKTINRTSYPHAEYHCFTAGPEWLAGMGMDDRATAPEAYRWSDEIVIISS